MRLLQLLAIFTAFTLTCGITSAAGVGRAVETENPKSPITASNPRVTQSDADVRQAIAQADSFANAQHDSKYHPLSPRRVLDTGVTKQRVKAGTTLDLVLAGKHGIPGTGAVAVSYNLTAVNPSGPGFLTAYPTGTTRPTTSTLNYKSNQVIANGVIGSLGTNGAITIYSMTDVDIVVDITGWFPPSTGYTPLTPVRALDTRVTKQRLAARSSLKIPVLGNYGIPNSGVAAVSYNLTAVKPDSPGFLTAHPAGKTLPIASNVNYKRNQNIANGVITKIGADGSIQVYSLAATDVVIDITGWFATESDYRPVTPVRAVDTRVNKTRLPARSSVTINVAGKHGLPDSGVSAVSYNLTAVDPSGPGFLTAYPTGEKQPFVSNLNFPASTNVANNAITKLGSGGSITVYSMTEVDVIIDITGWFSETPPTGTIEVAFDTPDGVPATVNIAKVAPTSAELAVVTKDNTGTAGTDSALVSTGQYRLLPAPVVHNGVSYEGMAEPSLVSVENGKTTQVTVTYRQSTGVQKLAAFTIEPNLVQLRWAVESNGVIVRRAEGRIAPVAPTDGSEVSAASTSLKDPSVSPGTVYSYRVFPIINGSPDPDLAHSAELTIETPKEAAVGVNQIRYMEAPGTLLPRLEEIENVTKSPGLFSVKMVSPVTPVKSGGTQVGAGIILPSSESLPGGAIGTIAGISQDGQTIVVRPGALSEVFTYFKSERQGSGFQSAADIGAVIRQGGRRLANAQPIEPRLAAAQEEGPCSVDRVEQLKFILHARDAKISHHNEIYLDKRRDWFGNEYPLGARVDMSSTMTIPLEVKSAANTKVECEFEFDGVEATYPVGPVPVTIGASLSTTAAAEVSSEATLTFDLKLGAQVRLGVGTQTQADSYANVQADLRDNKLSGEAGITIAIGGTVEVGIGAATKLIGAKVGVGLDITMIEFSAKVIPGKEDSVCLRLAASHKVSGNVHFKAWVDTGLGLRLKLKREIVIAKAEWDSWTQHIPSGCHRAETPSTGPGDGGGTPGNGGNDGGTDNGNGTVQNKKYMHLTGNPDHYWTSSSRLCAQATDESLACWSNEDSRFVRFNPADKWRSYATNENTGCGVKSDETGWCWGLVPNSDLVNTPNGHSNTDLNFFVTSPVQITGKWKQLLPGGKICGINDRNELVCLRDYQSNVRPQSPYPHTVAPGIWKKLHRITNGFCATREDDTVWCSGIVTMGSPKLDSSKTMVMLPGQWKSLKGNTRELCGQRHDHTTWCWGLHSSGNPVSERIQKPIRVPGFPADYDTGRQRACFRSWSGEVTCLGLDSNLNVSVSDIESVSNDRTILITINGTWDSFSLPYACGRKTDGSAWCAETRWNPATNKTDRSAMSLVPGEWDATIGAAGYNCGIKTTDKLVYCWGTGTGSLPPAQGGYQEPTKIPFP